MVTFQTPRLILVTTPLEVIKTRLRHNDFTADVPISTDRNGHLEVDVLQVRFPPEWPGGAVGLLPVWERELEADPGYEMMGGTMIDRAERIAVGQMTFRALPEEPGAVELGYGMNASYQGRGYATEMARRLVQWAVEQPSIRRITSACIEDNIASIRVLEKAGFTRISRRVDDEGPTILWEYRESGGI